MQIREFVKTGDGSVTTEAAIRVNQTENGSGLVVYAPGFKSGAYVSFDTAVVIAKNAGFILDTLRAETVKGIKWNRGGRDTPQLSKAETVEKEALEFQQFRAHRAKRDEEVERLQLAIDSIGSKSTLPSPESLLGE